MKRILTILTACSLLVLTFQNCSSQHQGEEESFSLQAIYPYEVSPQFFADVQIVGKEKNSGDWNYQFVASIVSVDNEDDFVDVELIFFKEDGSILCPRVTAQVNRGSNHIEVTSCKSSEDLKTLKVEVRAAISGESLKTIKVHNFEF